MLRICQALFLVVAYVHGVGALLSTDSASPPKAIVITATTMNGSGPVYVPAGSNLTIIGVSAYETTDDWFGGLAKITTRFEPLASDAIRNIQLNDSRAGTVEYTKGKLSDDGLFPQLTPPFFPSPDFHVLFRDTEQVGPLKRLSRGFSEYASRWKAGPCSSKPNDQKTNKPLACYNYTLIGARGEDSGWPAFFLTPHNDLSDSNAAVSQKVKNEPASLRLGPQIRVIEAPQRVEWETPRGDYPFQLNANATLSCVVVADWREEFNVSVLLVGQDGSQQDITNVFQLMNDSAQYRNASIYAIAKTQAGAILDGPSNFTETNNSAFVRRRHEFCLRATRVLDDKMDNKTLICQAVSKRFPSINASDSLFFRLVANQSALLAYHSNRSGVVFKHCPHANNLSLDLTKVNTFNWRCCVELGGGNADQMLITNRDLFWGFNFTNTKSGQSAFVNTQQEIVSVSSYIEFKEPQIERGFASRACFELYFKALQYTKDISFTFGMRRPGSPKWLNTTSYQFTQGTQKDASFSQNVSTKSGAFGAATGGLVSSAAALLLAVALAH
jgi:hypothetical protein